ncbi:MAG TPA: hypothetical protein VIY90_17285 [Steroidobacteraceae bacterium]
MTSEPGEALPANGAAAAAVLAVAIGSLVLGVCALAGDASPAVAHLLNVWDPTGPLAGVTTLAIFVWLVTWVGLARAWRRRNVDLKTINLLVLVLISVGLLLTFPPFMDLLQGK